MYTMEHDIFGDTGEVFYHPPCSSGRIYVATIFGLGTRDARVIFAPDVARAGILENMLKNVLALIKDNK